ncbi:MAG: hypothetical protein ACUVUR_06125 [bacterium]
MPPPDFRTLRKTARVGILRISYSGKIPLSKTGTIRPREYTVPGTTKIGTAIPLWTSDWSASGS